MAEALFYQEINKIYTINIDYDNLNITTIDLNKLNDIIRLLKQDKRCKELVKLITKFKQYYYLDNMSIIEHFDARCKEIRPMERLNRLREHFDALFAHNISYNANVDNNLQNLETEINTYTQIRNTLDDMYYSYNMQISSIINEYEYFESLLDEIIICIKQTIELCKEECIETNILMKQILDRIPQSERNSMRNIANKTRSHYYDEIINYEDVLYYFTNISSLFEQILTYHSNDSVFNELDNVLNAYADGIHVKKCYIKKLNL